MDLRHLRAFAMVVSERNFTRAAERLSIAQPPLSRQIRELETELGVTLFDRASRPVRLTEAGRIAYEQAVHILSSAEQLGQTMRQMADSRSPRFVIGVVGSIMFGALPGIIRRLREEAGNTEIELVELTTAEQVAALKSGRIDAGLGRVRIDDPAIRRQVLFNEPIVAVVPADDPLARSPAEEARFHLADVISRTLIVYPNQPRPSYADQVLGILRDHGHVPARLLEVREVQTALGLVAAQMGCALVPGSMQHLQREDIAYLPIAEAPTSPIILSHRAVDTNRMLPLMNSLAHSVLHGTLRDIPRA